MDRDRSFLLGRCRWATAPSPESDNSDHEAGRYSSPFLTRVRTVWLSWALLSIKKGKPRTKIEVRGEGERKRRPNWSDIWRIGWWDLRVDGRRRRSRSFCRSCPAASSSAWRPTCATATGGGGECDTTTLLLRRLPPRFAAKRSTYKSYSPPDRLGFFFSFFFWKKGEWF